MKTSTLVSSLIIGLLLTGCCALELAHYESGTSATIELAGLRGPGPDGTIPELDAILKRYDHNYPLKQGNFFRVEKHGNDGVTTWGHMEEAEIGCDLIAAAKKAVTGSKTVGVNSYTTRVGYRTRYDARLAGNKCSTSCNQGASRRMVQEVLPIIIKYQSRHH